MSPAPAIAALTEAREVAFVTALLELGGPHYAAEAAKRAGYAKTDADAEYAAALLLSHPRIAKAITGEVRRRFDIAAASALNTLLEVCVNPRAPANARISAAQEILNRSSMGPIASRSVSVSASFSHEDMVEAYEAQQTAERAAAAKTIEGSTTPSNGS